MTASLAFDSQTTLKPLAFNPAKLTGLSERLIQSHWESGVSVKALGMDSLSACSEPGSLQRLSQRVSQEIRRCNEMDYPRASQD